MKTIGQLLHDAREQKGISIDQLALETKIRPDYIVDIEADKFVNLPSATFVKGFIQNLANSLEIDPQTALAIFRRDFDQNQQGRIIPRGLANPIQTPSKLHNPRTTSILIAFVIVFLVGVYVFSQILNLTQAPEIELLSPKENEVTPAIVTVVGKTDSDATITVNQKPVATNLEGRFETSLDLSVGDHTIVIESKSRDGKTRTYQRHITVAPN